MQTRVVMINTTPGIASLAGSNFETADARRCVRLEGEAESDTTEVVGFDMTKS
jgi:hypothetical protein